MCVCRAGPQLFNATTTSFPCGLSSLPVPLMAFLFPGTSRASAGREGGTKGEREGDKGGGKFGNKGTREEDEVAAFRAMGEQTEPTCQQVNSVLARHIWINHFQGGAASNTLNNLTVIRIHGVNRKTTDWCLQEREAPPTPSPALVSRNTKRRLCSDMQNDTQT